MPTPHVSLRAGRPVGELVRHWRERRGLTQMRLAHDANVSPRHLSFIETGRSQPSREVVLRLAQKLDVPLRQRNALLLAGGFAPAFGEHSFDSPDFANVRHLIDQLLKGFEPNPALAVDRHWNIVAANGAVSMMMGGVSEVLLRPPVNALRLALHPDGAAPRIANFVEWRAHILERLRHQVDTTGDETLAALEQELLDYPAPAGIEPWVKDDSRVLVPLRLRTPVGLLRLVSTTMVFGTPLDVTLSELAIEVFLPVDEETAAAIRALGGK